MHIGLCTPSTNDFHIKFISHTWRSALLFVISYTLNLPVPTTWCHNVMLTLLTSLRPMYANKHCVIIYCLNCDLNNFSFHYRALTLQGSPFSLFLYDSVYLCAFEFQLNLYMYNCITVTCPIRSTCGRKQSTVSSNWTRIRVTERSCSAKPKHTSFKVMYLCSVISGGSNSRSLYCFPRL